MEVVVDDFVAKDRYHQINFINDEVTLIRSFQSRNVPANVNGWGLISPFRVNKGEFLSLFSLPEEFAGKYKGCYPSIFSFGKKSVNLSDSAIATSFKFGIIFRHFSIAEAGRQIFSIRYHPPFSWAANDGGMPHYHDIFWMAHDLKRVRS